MTQKTFHPYPWDNRKEKTIKCKLYLVSTEYLTKIGRLKPTKQNKVVSLAYAQGTSPMVYKITRANYLILWLYQDGGLVI